MKRKSALYALAVALLMGTIAVAALADAQWMNSSPPRPNSFGPPSFGPPPTNSSPQWMNSSPPPTNSSPPPTNSSPQWMNSSPLQTNSYGPPHPTVSPQPEQGVAQPNAGGVREPMKSGNVPDPSKGSSDQLKSGNVPDPSKGSSDQLKIRECTGSVEGFIRSVKEGYGQVAVGGYRGSGIPPDPRCRAQVFR